MPEKQKSELVLSREGKVGHISVIGDIGWDWFGISYPTFKQQLDDLGDVSIIEVEIMSPGGYVADGTAMMNSLRNHPAVIHTYINGYAASIASVLAMAGDKIFMPDNSLMFLHKPLNVVFGNADELRKEADALDKFEEAITNSYQRHFKGSDEEIQAIMAEDTWLTAEEVNDKFNNVIVMDSGGAQAVAHSDPVALLGGTEGPVASKEPEGGILKKILNLCKGHGETEPANTNEEVDMPLTPEEKTELTKDTASAVVAMLKDEGLVTAQAPAAEPTPAPAPVAKVEIDFEGDKQNPEDVAKHLNKVRMQQLEDSADLTTVAGVRAYQKALNELQNGSDAQPTPATPTNADTQQGVQGKAGEQKFTADEEDAAIARMTR